MNVQDVAIPDRVRAGAAARATIVAAIGVFLLDTVVRWTLVSLSGTVVSTAGVAVVTVTVLLGREARWAAGGGLLAAGLLLADPLGGLAWACGGFVAAIVGSRLSTVPRDRPSAPAPWLVRYVVVAVATLLALAAIAATSFELLDRAAFALVASRTVLDGIVPVLAVGPLLWAYERRFDAARWHVADRPTSPRASAAVLAALLGWVGGGSATSYVLGDLQRVPEHVLTARLPPGVTVFVSASGGRGEYAVLALCFVAGCVLAAVLYADRVHDAVPLVGSRPADTGE